MLLHLPCPQLRGTEALFLVGGLEDTDSLFPEIPVENYSIQIHVLEALIQAKSG